MVGMSMEVDTRLGQFGLKLQLEKSPGKQLELKLIGMMLSCMGDEAR